jgi:hypothetical protein
VGGHRSGGAQGLRELAEAGPRGGGEVEARPHGLAQRRGTGRRQGTHLVGQLFIDEQGAHDGSLGDAMKRKLQNKNIGK